MTYRQMAKVCRSVGMSVSNDGLAFTVCNGRLVNGDHAPEWIRRINGCTVEEAARAIQSHGEQVKD
jgi:hypothetical protein